MFLTLAVGLEVNAAGKLSLEFDTCVCYLSVGLRSYHLLTLVRLDCMTTRYSGINGEERHLDYMGTVPRYSQSIC